MTIIKAPHATLRAEAQPITHIDKKLYSFIKDLEKTLATSSKPKGVGLAAPQVNKKYRIFTTLLTSEDEADREHDIRNTQSQTYINPRITKKSLKQVLGPDDKEYTLEGCLSIPLVYGPAPRWEWVELTYESIMDDTLVTQKQRFSNFAARVIQHEVDHLDGILFTDYILEHDLPAYLQNEEGKLEDITDRDILNSL